MTFQLVFFGCPCGWSVSLQWRHNGPNGVSNHQPHYCLLNRLFRSKSKKTSTLRVTGLCVGNSPVTGEFPAQMASNAEMFPFDDVIMIGPWTSAGRVATMFASCIYGIRPLRMKAQIRCLFQNVETFSPLNFWPLVTDENHLLMIV